ncbi:MAG: UDP-N-acetylmuramoyl-L-alanine--D-glutamate ligase [bacterium]|nr:UDP-N-acetylmuramoyl-L-alanine--D-glutamate ligase [bacterium]
MKEIERTKFLVVGLGETGFDAALALKKHGADVKVTEIKEGSGIIERKKKLQDSGIAVETGKHSPDFVEWADVVIPSPGVPLDALPVEWAKKRNIKILSEIELAYHLSSSKKIIAITGTNGKTTTVSFTDLVFKKAGIPHITCGNIGNSFIGELDNINDNTWIILEVSSFQLEYIEDFRASIGVILNITDDHLDYYKDFYQYVEAKKKLFTNFRQDDLAILNFDNPWCKNIGERLKCRKLFFSSKNKIDGICISDGFISYNNKKFFSLEEFEKSKLMGIHNLENLMAVAGIVDFIEIKSKAISEALLEFVPPKHRLEKVATINGITFIDDSKATNVDAVCRALESFPQNNNIFLILGGKDKNISFQPLKKFLTGRVKKIFLIGEASKRIKNELDSSGVKMVEVKNFDEVVKLSIVEGSPGDFVLLSPGCSSFDMFSSYAERGDVFKNSVKNLL